MGERVDIGKKDTAINSLFRKGYNVLFLLALQVFYGRRFYHKSTGLSEKTRAVSKNRKNNSEVLHWKCILTENPI
jgi:hypothetical protein